MKKTVIILIIICALAAAMLCACSTPVPVNGEYDITRGVTGTRGSISFTLASYNVHGGGSSRAVMEKITAQIDESGADIANLQEVDADDSPRGEGGYTSILTGGRLDGYFFAPTLTLQLGDKYGLMTTFCGKADDALSLFLPYPGDHYKGDVEPRIVTRTLITIDGVQIAVYNTHLEFVNEQMDGGTLRGAQMKFVFDLMESDPCPYKVLSGDFNVESLDEFAVFAQSGKYALLVNKQNPLPTYNTEGDEFACLDNIIYTCDTLELIEGEMITSDLSDHNMLLASFKTK